MKGSVSYQHQDHYYMSQTPTGSEQEILIVLHGYGQLANFFIKKFHTIFSEKRLVVMPEVTNYVYKDGFAGRVGASWMTSHERETAIANNNNYLKAILESVLINQNNKPAIQVLGFSQCAVTASRWICQLAYKVDKLVLWSGGFAHDLDVNLANERLLEAGIFVVLGDEDQILTKESIAKQEDWISSFPFTVKRIEFKGGHDIDISVLKRIFDHP